MNYTCNTTWTYHQLIGDLRDHHAKGEQVQAGVVLKQVAGWLLENDEGQGEDESNVQARTQHTGILHRRNVIKYGLLYYRLYRLRKWEMCVCVDLQPQSSHFYQHLHLKWHRNSCSRSRGLLQWCQWWGRCTASHQWWATKETCVK